MSFLSIFFFFLLTCFTCVRYIYRSHNTIACTWKLNKTITREWRCCGLDYSAMCNVQCGRRRSPTLKKKKKKRIGLLNLFNAQRHHCLCWLQPISRKSCTEDRAMCDARGKGSIARGHHVNKAHLCKTFRRFLNTRSSSEVICHRMKLSRNWSNLYANEVQQDAYSASFLATKMSKIFFHPCRFCLIACVKCHLFIFK